MTFGSQTNTQFKNIIFIMILSIFLGMMNPNKSSYYFEESLDIYSGPTSAFIIMFFKSFDANAKLTMHLSSY